MRTFQSNNLAERRKRTRFPIEQELLYNTVGPRLFDATGTGKTINISSGGLLFETTNRLPRGMRVQVFIDWPVRLDTGCRLRFMAIGQLVRVEGMRAAMRIDKYEFRTRRTNGPSDLGGEMRAALVAARI